VPVSPGFALPQFSTKIFSYAQSASSGLHSRFAWRTQLIAMAHNDIAFQARDTICYTSCISLNREAHVDHALKLNVLAVCAVFVFVGAVLLGAF
jgi:hypothetical protein